MSAGFFRRMKKIGSACFASLVAVNVQADVTLTNVSVTQRPGTKLLDITYDVSSSTENRVSVSLSVSNGTEAVACPSVTGDIGENIPTGTGNAVVWDMGTDWNGATAELSCTLTADDITSGGSTAGMALIPAGSYQVTNPDSELYSYPLSVDSFYMDVTEVTKAHWDTVYNWAVSNGYGFDNAGSGKASDHPVQTVNWYDCVKWCNARSEMEGLTPCYTVSGNTYKTGQNVPGVNTAVNGYRLPTTDEWEHAARGGLSDKRFPWGDTITHSDANYYSDSSYSYDTSPTRGFHPDYDIGSYPFTCPAGSLPANGYGLYNMAANVSEWCGSSYNSYMILRGSNWGFYANVARCGQEALATRDTADYRYGFRTICRASVPETATGTVTQSAVSVSCDTRDYTLEVVAAHGAPTPAVGTHSTYSWKSSVTCSVEEVTSDGWMFMGWTGDVETDYTQPQVTILMDTTSKTVEALFSDDADGDGLLNTDEITLECDPRNPDTDGDSMEDYAEWVAGTSPTNAASILALTCQTLADDSHQLSWQGVFKRFYTIEVSDSLTSGWQSDPTEIRGKDALMSVTVPDTGTHQFYRIRVRN